MSDNLENKRQRIPKGQSKYRQSRETGNIIYINFFFEFSVSAKIYVEILYNVYDMENVISKTVKN